MEKAVFITKTVVDSILSYAKGLHPREGILLLRGEVTREKIIVNDTVIPPLATHGAGFSSFPLFPLPMDPSIVGVAHSHPSGGLEPSVEDLNHFYGRVMVIAAYPYRSSEDVAVFSRQGNVVKYKII